MKNKKFIALAALLVILTGVATGTLAYFTTKNVAHNVVKSDHIDIELVEIFDKDAAGSLMPGQTIQKVVKVKNNHTEPAWVRVKVEFTQDSKQLPWDQLVIDWNEEDWQQVGDYYYYLHPLMSKNEETKPLFNSVKLKEDTGNAYQNAKIELAVTAEGIQQANNTLDAGESITSVWPAVSILPWLE